MVKQCELQKLKRNIYIAFNKCFKYGLFFEINKFCATLTKKQCYATSINISKNIEFKVINKQLKIISCSINGEQKIF